MKILALLMLFVCSPVIARTCQSPDKLLSHLRVGSFSPFVEGKASIKALGFAERDGDSLCVYGLTLIMSNGHGATRLILTRRDGYLVGTYFLTSATFLSLEGESVLVRDMGGRIEKLAIGERGVPKTIFFDGEISQNFLPK